MSDQQTPTSPSAGTTRRPLRRRREGRLIAGVAAGVADHLDIDVVLVRIVFVLTAIFTSGLGLLAYLLGWIFIPEDVDEPAPSARPGRADSRSARDPLFWVGMGLLVAGAAWLLGGPVGPVRWFPPLFDPGLIVPLLLIGLGIALWRTGERRAEAAASPPPPPPPPGSPGAPPPQGEQQPPPSAAAPTTPPSSTSPSEPERRSESTVSLATDQPNRPTEHAAAPGSPGQGDAAPDVPAGPPPQGPEDGHGAANMPPAGGQPPHGPTPPTTQEGGDWTPPPAPERERSVLGQITLGVMLLVVGVLWALRMAGAVHLPFGRIIAVALLVVGAGLLLGSIVGRARWLIVVGVVLLPLVVVGELLRPLGFLDVPGPGMRGPVGEVQVEPESLDDLATDYQVGMGSLRLDLREITFTEDTDVDLQVGAGEVRVFVPDDVDVEVRVRLGAGETRLFGESHRWIGVDRTVSDEVGGDATLRLDIQVGFGDIGVDRSTGTSNDLDVDVGSVERQSAPPLVLVPAA